jgi:hypothetical protein
MQKMTKNVLVDNVVSYRVDWAFFVVVVYCKLITLEVVWCALTL